MWRADGGVVVVSARMWGKTGGPKYKIELRSRGLKRGGQGGLCIAELSPEDREGARGDGLMSRMEWF